MSTNTIRKTPPEAEVASPCTKVCVMDAQSGHCRGCFRTLDEIAAWRALDPEGKKAVLAELPARRAKQAKTSR